MTLGVAGDPVEGSSPLARGLPGIRRLWRRRSGIIPARAGFTRFPGRPRRRAADHPRSRGVYADPTVPRIVASGSSPLARGLLQPSRVEHGRPRIIPARAGFTPKKEVPEKYNEDHPRSRGVYTWNTVWGAVSGGSSPLARGLPCLSLSLFLLCLDHPRSRGVYSVRSTMQGPSRGSSPLARGLLRDLHLGQVEAGIIPARAGFTEQRAQLLGSAQGSSPLARGLREVLGSVDITMGDHPRSRGVYAASGRSMRSALGSSPLARGLPWSEAYYAEVWRIIPARAGFTGRRGRGVLHAADHPRSRGVYCAVTLSPLRLGGSSPLARGLLRAGTGLVEQQWIIPARAGFTKEETNEHQPHEDHPRSRGVYPASWPAGRSGSGSSPLARGLPDRPRAGASGGRIIPARAGFTTCRSTARSAWRDHPRSRGVYPRRPRSGSPAGSSPLARGLLVRTFVRRRGWGIIPARAGFTRTRGRPACLCQDHPRSRGVYSAIS